MEYNIFSGFLPLCSAIRIKFITVYNNNYVVIINYYYDRISRLIRSVSVLCACVHYIYLINIILRMCVGRLVYIIIIITAGNTVNYNIIII